METGQATLSSSTPVIPASVTAGPATAGQYLPEPSTTGIGTFRDVLQTAGNYAADFASLASSANTGGFQDLLAAQIQVQVEMQQVSMVSNVEKSRHETKMAAIRNVRVG